MIWSNPNSSHNQHSIHGDGLMSYRREIKIECPYCSHGNRWQFFLMGDQNDMRLTCCGCARVVRFSVVLKPHVIIDRREWD